MTDNHPDDGEPGPPPTPAGLADERFAANIREERDRQKKSQADVAKAMKERGWSWHPQTVQRAETGHRKVSIGEAEALAGILHTTVDRLTWPGRAASAAGLLDMTIARGLTGWDEIADGTAELLWAQYQLGVSIAEAERAGYYGSDKIQVITEEARSVMGLTAEDAVEAGRKHHEGLRETGAQMLAAAAEQREAGESD